MPPAARASPIKTRAPWLTAAPTIRMATPTPSATTAAEDPRSSPGADAGDRGGVGGGGAPAGGPPCAVHQVVSGGAIVRRNCVIGPVPAVPSGADSGGGVGSEAPVLPGTTGTAGTPGVGDAVGLPGAP